MPNFSDVTQESGRPRPGQLTPETVFRGHTPGDRIGPYLSQFFFLGNQVFGNGTTTDGLLTYGSIRIDLRVYVATPGLDFMQTWADWLRVQDGFVPQDSNNYDGHFRFITTPRDLATYVHFDALYEAYLNACIFLLGANGDAHPAPFDPTFAHLSGQAEDNAFVTGFALFGGPHVLTLVTEVATRALKAVRFQKFNNHLRLRPEALAGRIASSLYRQGPLFRQYRQMAGSFREIIEAITTHNNEANNQTSTPSTPPTGTNTTLNPATPLPTSPTVSPTSPQTSNVASHHRHGHGGANNGDQSQQRDLSTISNLALLPMAFPEGSPMHPSYGAGHATVAGACVTMLKAFFDEDAVICEDCAHNVRVVPLDVALANNYTPVAYVPERQADGSSVLRNTASVVLGNDSNGNPRFLKLGDELNKIAGNISIGRNWAGVHYYYSDYIDSLRMGEEIAIDLLRDQAQGYTKDRFPLSFTSFDGVSVLI